MYRALCFVDNDQGRDVELLLPLIYHAEKYLNCEVKFRFVWDIIAIYREQPDIVILANTVGSKWLFEVAKYANKQNIKVFALISEGNFRTNGTFDYWGYNTDHEFYQDYVCLWSKRTLDFFKEKLPLQAHKMVFTGATGFDRYKIYQFPKKEAFLQRKGLTQFKKVIGYAGWAFGKIHSRIGRQELKYYLKDKPDWMKWTEKQRSEVENILRQLIENNRDTLFILKVHPNETHAHITKESPNEMYRLKGYPNVLYVKNEEPIHDLISASDIWLGFETTSAIEAWMLNKETVLINPDPDFTRGFAHNVSVVAQTYEAVQTCIDEFYREGKIVGFNTHEKVELRSSIIAETIGFSDGLNHLRAAHYLAESLKRTDEQQKKRVFRLKYFLRSFNLHIGSLLYNRWLFLHLPKFKKTVWAFDRWKLKNIPVLKEKYYPFLDEFYERNHCN
jgi:surface carbohydrate biosynthesis protein